jgi:hypothetical protein
MVITILRSPSDRSSSTSPTLVEPQIFRIQMSLVDNDANLNAIPLGLETVRH